MSFRRVRRCVGATRFVSPRRVRRRIRAAWRRRRRVISDGLLLIGLRVLLKLLLLSRQGRDEVLPRVELLQYLRSRRGYGVRSRSRTSRKTSAADERQLRRCHLRRGEALRCHGCRGRFRAGVLRREFWAAVRRR